MSKGKKRLNSNGNGNGKKDYINSLMESAKAQKEKSAAEKEEAARQDFQSLNSP